MASSSSSGASTAAATKEQGQPHEVIGLLKEDVIHGNETGYWRPVPYRDHRFQMTLYNARNLERQQSEILAALQQMYPGIPEKGLRKMIETFNGLTKLEEKKFCEYTITSLPEAPPLKKMKQPVASGWIIFFKVYYTKLLDKVNGINLWCHFHAISVQEIPERYQTLYKAWFFGSCLCCCSGKDAFYKNRFEKKQFSLMESTEGQLTASQDFQFVEFAEGD